MSDDILNEEIDLFAEIIRTEDLIKTEKAALKAVSDVHQNIINTAQKDLEALWAKMSAYMKETGQPELTLPGDINDYKIAFKQGSERVVVADPDAVPEEFVKMERAPKLSEIKEHIKNLPEGETVNWATIERGPESIGWKAIKRKAANVEA